MLSVRYSYPCACLSGLLTGDEKGHPSCGIHKWDENLLLNFSLLSLVYTLSNVLSRRPGSEPFVVAFPVQRERFLLYMSAPLGLVSGL